MHTLERAVLPGHTIHTIEKEKEKEKEKKKAQKKAHTPTHHI
jgi:hypothetical protein